MPNLSWPHQSSNTHCEYTHCYIREENESSRTSCRAPYPKQMLNLPGSNGSLFHRQVPGLLDLRSTPLPPQKKTWYRIIEGKTRKKDVSTSKRENKKESCTAVIKRWWNRWPASGHCSRWLQFRMESYSVELRFHRWWKHLQINIQWPKRMQNFNDIY